MRPAVHEVQRLQYCIRSAAGSFAIFHPAAPKSDVPCADIAQGTWLVAPESVAAGFATCVYSALETAPRTDSSLSNSVAPITLSSVKRI